ncbi:MAG: MFS transporter [Chloroflexi bacterium]|nr:MFS transporter [Chloroflexota bacterium]
MAFQNYREIFREAPYRWFWSGFTFSMLGDAMTRVALTWFVYEATHSSEALGWLMVCYTGPVIVGGLMAGSLLDRFDRRAVMIADSLIRGVTVALVPILHVTGHLALWHVYAVAAVYGLLMMISLAGVPSLIPALVPRERLSTANALETLSYMIGGVAGPLIAGWLIPRLGAPNVVMVDALSYFVFAFALRQMRLTDPPHPASAKEQQAHTMGDAARLLLTNPILFSTTFMYMAANIGAGFVSVFLPFLSDQWLGGGSQVYGLLLGAMSLGEVLSALAAGSITFSLSLGTLICAALALTGASLGLLLIPLGLWTVLPGLFLFGAFSSPLTIWAQTLRMQIIPERLRGRTFALLRTLMQAWGPIGGGLAGVILPVIGLPAMIALSATMVGAPGIIGYQVEPLRAAGPGGSPEQTPP